MYFKSKLERHNGNVHHKHENFPRARVTIDNMFANLYDDLPMVYPDVEDKILIQLPDGSLMLVEVTEPWTAVT